MNWVATIKKVAMFIQEIKSYFESMKSLNYSKFLFLFLLTISCSSSKIVSLATQGDLSKENFNVEIPFYYLEKYIYVDVLINGKSYPFLFDTGTDITYVDQSLADEIDFTPVKEYNTTGSSIEDIKLQYGFLSSLNFGGIEFSDFGIGLQDLSHVKSCFSDNRKIYGILGANILRKGYWQINYQQQSMKCSNTIENFQPSSDAIKISMIPKSKSGWGITRIRLEVNGVVENFVFDTGSYGSFTGNPAFLKKLEKGDNPLVELVEKSKAGKRKYGFEKMLLDTLELSDQELMIEEKVSLLIGNDFWEEYVVTIDWKKNELYLQPT